MLVFVTGGTGHSGPYIISDLIAAGHEVTALARSDAAAAAVAALGAKVHRGNLEDLDGLKEAAAASDGVIHLAHRQDLIPTGGSTPLRPRSLRSCSPMAKHWPEAESRWSSLEASARPAGRAWAGRPPRRIRPFRRRSVQEYPAGSQHRGNHGDRSRRKGHTVFDRADP
ncbi:NAD(P)H-binding protein [Pseudomonas sp. PCH446]